MSDPGESLSRIERREVREIAESAARRVASTVRSGEGSDRSGFNRRDTLKLGGFGALIAGFATLGSQAAVEPAAADDDDKTPNPNLKNLESGQWNLSKDTVTSPVAPQHGTSGPAARFFSKGGGPKQDELYCFGDDYNGDPQVAVYDFKDNAWSLGTPDSTSTAGGGAALVEDRDGIFVLNSDGFREYHVPSDEWRNHTDPPDGGRAAVALAAVDGVVYRFGGDNSSTGGTLESFEDGSWTSHSSIPGPPRIRSTAVSHNGDIYLIGTDWGYPEGKRFDRYDPSADSWERLPDLPFETNTAGAAVHDGKIYVVGGFAHATQVYDIQDGTWEWYPGAHGDPSTWPAVGASDENDTPDAVFEFGAAHEDGSVFRADAFGTISGEGDDDGDDDDDEEEEDEEEEEEDD